jgi:hypothetical protein
VTPAIQVASVRGCTMKETRFRHLWTRSSLYNIRELQGRATLGSRVK